MRSLSGADRTGALQQHLGDRGGGAQPGGAACCTRSCWVVFTVRMEHERAADEANTI